MMNSTSQNIEGSQAAQVYSASTNDSESAAGVLK